MEIIKLEMILKQVSDLGNLVNTSFLLIDEAVQKAFSKGTLKHIRTVYAVGDGDSFHAALAAELAFHEFSGLMYYPREAMRFLEYNADYIDRKHPASTLVLGISASGGSIRVIQALERALGVNEGVVVAGMVGNQNSKVAEVVKTVISTQIPSFGASPGIRTFAASYMGLIALAIRIGEARGILSQIDVAKLHQEILSLVEPIDRIATSSIDIARQAGKQFRSSNFISFVGSGPSFGAAVFSSAKIVEIAGIYAVGQDLEEWAHVEGLAYPLDFPVYMVAPSGKGYWRAEKLATLVTALGHPLILVGQRDESHIKTKASYFFPLDTKVREAFSPLITHIPASLFAYFLAEEAGRLPFMRNITQA